MKRRIQQLILKVLIKAIYTKIVASKISHYMVHYIITPHAHDTLHPMYYVPVNVSEQMDVTHPTLWCCNKMAACDITTNTALHAL